MRTTSRTSAAAADTDVRAAEPDAISLVAEPDPASSDTARSVPGEPPTRRRPWSLLSLRAWLLLIVTLATIPQVAVISCAVLDWRARVVAEAAAHAHDLANRAATVHQRQIADVRDVLAGLVPIAAAAPNRPQLSASLGLVLRHDAAYVNVGLLAPDGTPIGTATPANLPPALVSTGFLQRVSARRRFTVGEFDVRSGSGPALAVAATPVTRAPGGPHLLFAIVRLTWVAEFEKEPLLPAGASITMFNRRGTVIAYGPGPPKWVGLDASQDPVFRAAAAGNATSVRATSFDSVPRLFAFRPLVLEDQPEASPLYFALGIPTATATASDDRLIRRNLAAFAIAFLLASAAALAGGDRVLVRHVKRLVATTKHLKEGDTSARARLEGGPKELRQLSGAFDDMADALERRERQILHQHEQIARQEQRFRALIEHSSDGIMLLDVSGRITYVSPSMTRILGSPIDQLISRDVFALAHPHDAPAVRSRFADLTQLPRGFTSATLRLSDGTGGWRWVGVAATNLLDQPHVRAVVANIRDMTEWREAQEALFRSGVELEARVRQRTAELTQVNQALRTEIEERQRAEESLRKLSRAIEQTADSIIITDHNGTIEYVNPAFETMTGYSAAEAIGRNPRIISSGLHSRHFYEDMWNTISSGQVFRSILTNRTKDGHLFEEDQIITPIRDAQGRITHFIGCGRDITKRRQTEEALRRLNNQLEHEATRIAGVLHDEAGQFLTSAHITLADVARGLPPEARERLKEVRGHLDQVEGQLRRLSHELRPRILDDLGLVDAVRFLAEAVALRTGLDIQVDAEMDRRCPPIIETAVYRMVQETLTNTTKHAAASHITIVLRRERNSLTCSIRDDGVGFDVVAALTRRGETGLGLRGIQDRLEAVGGTCEITSAPGAGTELRTTIPLED